MSTLKWYDDLLNDACKIICSKVVKISRLVCKNFVYNFFYDKCVLVQYKVMNMNAASRNDYNILIS